MARRKTRCHVAVPVGTCVLLAIALLGCASTSISSQVASGCAYWKPKRILVAFPEPDLRLRRVAENAIAKRIRQRGIEAVPSNELFMAGRQYSAEEGTAILIGSGVDAGLLVTVYSAGSESTYIPPRTYTNWYWTPYGGYAETRTTPGYDINFPWFNFTASLYGGANWEMMWTATGNTSGIESVAEMMLASMSARIVNQLERDGVVPKKGSSYAQGATGYSAKSEAPSRTPLSNLGQTAFRASSFRYCNKEKGFSIEFPSNWIQQKPADAYGVVMSFSPPRGTFDLFREYAWVGVEEMVMPFTLEQYFQASLRQMATTVEAFQEIGREAIEVAGTEARWLMYTFKNDGMNMRAVSELPPIGWTGGGAK